MSDQAMIEAAIDLLLAHGAAKTTLAAIGERAGYSRGLATYRFGSKAGLFTEIFKVVSKRWLGFLTREVGEMQGVDAMCAALDAYLAFVAESARDAQVLQLLYGEATNPSAESSSAACDTYRRQIADVSDWLSAGQAGGTVRQDIDIRIEATRFIAYIAGMTHLWMLMPETTDFPTTNDAYKRNLRATLANTK